MNIILLGPPGAGKGTQASLLCQRFAISHISTGEMLRQAIYRNTELGLQAKLSIEAGRLVSDDIIINLVKEEILSQKHPNGFLLDGFPRNLVQGKALKDTGIFINFIIYLDLDDQTIIERLSGRRCHPNSGRIYHIKYNPPKNPNIDDITGEQLIIRKDDQEEVIKERLYVYHQITKPLIEWYRNEDNKMFVKIDASKKQAEIFAEIEQIIIEHN